MNSSVLYLLESGICLALFYAVYWAFLKKETFFSLNRSFLILSIPVSFIIPLINVPSPFATRPFIDKTYAFNQPGGTQINYPGITDVIWLIFLLGAGLFFLRLFYQLVQIFILIKRNGFQKQDGVKTVFIDKNSAPFSFFNFFFINKSNISDQDLKRIIAHEFVHIKQYHSIDLILLELLTIFQWFNPFVWPYKKSLKETHEYLADNAVIAQGCSKPKYQMLIFEQHVGGKLFEFAHNFNRSQIKRRITMMEKIKSRGRVKLKVLLILPIVWLLLFAFAEPKPAEEPEPSAMNDIDTGILALEDSKDSTLIEDQKKAEEQKKKEQHERQKELLLKEKELKEALAKTEDPEKRAAIKKKLKQLQMMKEGEYRKAVAITEADIKIKEAALKKALAKTEDAEKKAEIKKKLKELQMMKAFEKKEKVVLVKPAVITDDEWVKEMEMLKKKIKETDDPEKKAELKKKLEEMKKKQMKKKKEYEEYKKQKEAEKKKK